LVNENNIYQNIINKLSLENIINICLWKTNIDNFKFLNLNLLRKEEQHSFKDLVSYYIVV
jgi:hypothetical protein